MNAIVLLAVLASGQSNLSLSDRLTVSSPPLLISAVETQPRLAPSIRTAATTALIGGWAVSIANTSAFWLTRSGNGFFENFGAVIGVMVSTVPIAGPAFAIVADLLLGPTGDDPFWGGRIAINAVSFAAQLGGIIFLSLADRFDAPALKGFTVVPGKNGLSVGYSGTF
ncbi:MAG: hypothetical protein QM817_28320 [Archangium sp.]